MPAYSIRLIPHRCPCCARPATHEVRNARNEHVGYRCAKAAKTLVQQLNRSQP